MHRCLSIPELLDSIAEWLQYTSDTFPPSTPTPNALINFASTCRVFYEPSMNVLWHTLLSLKPLVKCFSQHIWQEKDGMVTIINLPTQRDWDAFLRNARRVRVVLYFYTNGGLTKKAFEVLSFQRPVPYLLPRLQTLTITLEKPRLEALTIKPENDRWDMPFVNLLIGPLIEHWHAMISHGNETLLLALLDKILNTADAVLSIGLQGHTPQSLAIDTALKRIISRSSKHLQHLTLKTFPVLTPDMFARLATMPSLIKLDVCIVDSTALAKTIDSRVDTPFAVLQSLELGVNNLQSSSVASLLRAIKSPQLEKVIVSYVEHPSSQDLKSLFEAATSHRRLESFGVCMSGDWDDDFQDRPDTEVVDIEILRPLLRLSLQVLRISDIAVRLNSEDIPEVARALPSIRVLVLEPNGSQVPISPPKLAELIHFAKHCPFLDTLNIWVDATDVKIDEIRPGMDHEGKLLTFFRPGYSPISKLGPVAAFLSDVFPNVKIKQLWGDNPVAGIEEWNEVGYWVGVLTEIRKQERRSH